MCLRLCFSWLVGVCLCALAISINVYGFGVYVCCWFLVNTSYIVGMILRSLFSMLCVVVIYRS